MEKSLPDRLALASRIYDLDAEVYRVLGSSLGRVFNGRREACIEELAEQMCSPTENHVLRSDMALISNMARTIPSKTERARIMTEYNAILKALESQPHTFGSVDILDKKLARLNLTARFAGGSHLIVCIGRTYGCAGTDIGFALADKLKINYYDSEIFAQVLNRLEADADSVTDRASFARHQDLNKTLGVERHRPLKQRIQEFNRYHGLPKQDAIFFNQSDLLCDMAQKEDFIVMGRCADVILTNHHIPHVSIFIDAPFELRARRVMSTDSLSYKEACRLLKRLDRRHGHYYRFYTGRRWGHASNYDLCINSASYGIEGCVQVIERLIKRAQG